MPSVYSPRWTEPEIPITRNCDMPGCDCLGEYKAPKSRYSSESKDYHWFCIEHVKQYNQSWNYFSGMSEPEMEQFWRTSQAGERPTWQRHSKMKVEDLSDAVRRSFADYLAGEASQYSTRLVPVDRKTQKALAVLDLQWPVTEKEVKLRYKSLVKQHHPDVNQQEDAADYFKKITEAYQYIKQIIQKPPEES